MHMIWVILDPQDAILWSTFAVSQEASLAKLIHPGADPNLWMKLQSLGYRCGNYSLVETIWSMKKPV